MLPHLRDEVEFLKSLAPKDERYFVEKYNMLLKKREKSLREFYTHLSMYLAVNVVLVGIYLVFTRGTFPWFLFPLIFWGISVLVNFSLIAKYLNRASYEKWAKEQIERERAQSL